MQTIRHLVLALFACVPYLHAAEPGKTQNLTSPGQVPEGLARSDWSSIRAAYEAGCHAFQPIEGGWQARNPGQQWTTKFDGRGFLAQPRGADWQWGLELKTYGFPGAKCVVAGVPAVKAEGQRLSCDWDAALQEWFVNDQRGLEHGFTLRARPAGAADAPLLFDLTIRGTLTPRLTTDALGVEFRDAAGATVLTYGGLKVWDADGKVLPSRFGSFDSQLSTPDSRPTVRLLIEERGARYPLTIDPIAQLAYLKAGRDGGGSPNDQFGRSVAVAGDTVVVGAPGEDGRVTGVNGVADESAGGAGAAYIFVRSGTTWVQQAYLKAWEVSFRDDFGTSVAVSGDTVVVGAPHEDGNATGVNGTADDYAGDSGAAYVFVRSGTTWSQQAYLKASQVSMMDDFGTSVAVSGDTVVVGAPYEDGGATGVNGTADETISNTGAAYVFVRNGTTWSQEAYLKASQVSAGDYFGSSVAVSGITVVVGIPGEDGSATGANGQVDELAANSGAACVFVRSGTTWSQEAYLKASQVSGFDLFGHSVAISGDTVVVGAPYEDGSVTGVNGPVNESASFAGAACVFVRSGTTWSQQAYLKASQVSAEDWFGYSVAVSGDTVVVGAYKEDGSAAGVNAAADEGAADAGAACVFVRSGTTWSQQAYLKASQVSLNDSFGISVAVSGDTVVIGAENEDGSATGVNGTVNESASAAGAACVFVRGGTAWSQQAYLKAYHKGSSTGDEFGYSVAVSGDTVVVGAPHEKGSGAGVNATADEGSISAGAAYVFVRSGAGWSQQAYLKASQVSSWDGFGWSVAVSGDTVVVGARGESGSATGVNGPVDELAEFAGAAYVFVRSGTTWSQQAYLKASQVSRGDGFGHSVAVAGDTVVVGAPYESSNSTGVNGPENENFAFAGAAYVFVRSGTTWSQQAYLKASQVSQADDFGYSVAVSGDTVVVGAWMEDGSATGVNGTADELVDYAGAAYVFVRDGTTWTQQAYLKASQVTSRDAFGVSVGVSGDTVVVGAHGEDGGAAYVFVRSGTTWSQQAYLKASQVSMNDDFGGSVAISGDTVVVGAPLEDGSATGVNGPVNELEVNAGAAYVFVRSGTTWSQQAYLKASQVSADDGFGYSVAVSGDTVVVGATGEDGSATEVNGPADELSNSAGAAYLFTLAQRDYATWAIANGVSTDPAANGGANLLAFAFGYAPGSPGGDLVYTGTFAGSGTITATGKPVTRFEGTDFRGLFVRPGDHLAAGLTYTPQFSANLTTWVDSAAIPTVLADDGTHEVVSVPYPLVGGEPARFFRLRITITP